MSSLSRDHAPSITAVTSGQPDMVERVARALCAELAGSNPDEMIHHPAQKSWEEPSWARWEQWADAARAAIAAMREPTETMSTAGKHAVKGCESTFEREIAETAYAVMIDAALQSAPPIDPNNP